MRYDTLKSVGFKDGYSYMGVFLKFRKQLHMHFNMRTGTILLMWLPLPHPIVSLNRFDKLNRSLHAWHVDAMWAEFLSKCNIVLSAFTFGFWHVAFLILDRFQISQMKDDKFRNKCYDLLFIFSGHILRDIIKLIYW